MNGFQWIACTLLAAAVARDLFGRGARGRWTLRVARSSIWCLAMVAIVNPLWVTRVANLLGIGRGADIILYVLALAFVATTFAFYAQHLRLRREVSKLAGHLALANPQFGGVESTEPRGGSSPGPRP